MPKPSIITILSNWLSHGLKMQRNEYALERHILWEEIGLSFDRLMGTKFEITANNLVGA